MVHLAEGWRLVLRDGAWRLGCQVGTVLEGAPLLMKPWGDEGREAEGRLWFEFSLIGAVMAFSLFLVFYALMGSSLASAHGGGLAADGCHNDRKNGGRHCHRGSQEGKPTRSPDGGIYYPNCTAARQAGAAPIYRGQPGYGSHLDRDGDGKACE